MLLQTDGGVDLRAHLPECSVGKGSCYRKSEIFRTSKDVSGRDVTIILLKKEIETALESLQEVQVEMAKLHSEKEEIQISENRKQESLECFTTLILAIQADMSNFEKQFEIKMNAVNHKLQSFERIVQEAGTYWCQTKEVIY